MWRGVLALAVPLLAAAGLPPAGADGTARLVLTGTGTRSAEVRFTRPVSFTGIPAFSRSGSVTAFVVERVSDGTFVVAGVRARVFEDAAARVAATSSNPVPGANAHHETAFWTGDTLLEPGDYRFHLVADARAEVRMTLSGLGRDIAVRATRPSPARAWTHAFRDPLTQSVHVQPVTLAGSNELLVGVVARYSANPGASGIDLCVTPPEQRTCGTPVAGLPVGRDQTYSVGWGSYGYAVPACGEDVRRGPRNLVSAVRATTPGTEGASAYVHLPTAFAVSDCGPRPLGAPPG